MKNANQRAKVISKAEALSTLEDNPGWKVLEEWINETIESCRTKLASPKFNNNWNTTIRLQAKHEVLVNLLFLKQKGIEDGIKLKQSKENESDNS